MEFGFRPEAYVSRARSFLSWWRISTIRRIYATPDMRNWNKTEVTLKRSPSWHIRPKIEQFSCCEKISLNSSLWRVWEPSQPNLIFRRIVPLNGHLDWCIFCKFVVMCSCCLGLTLLAVQADQPLYHVVSYGLTLLPCGSINLTT